MPPKSLSERVREMIGPEQQHFVERTQHSRALAQRAVETMPCGVPTNVCALDPYPLAIAWGRGAEVYDIDGHQYVDYHNGFGTSVFGHANQAIERSIRKQLARGTHFGALTEPVVALSEHLVDRYQLNWVRFSPSGTEATMDALRLARSLTGRELTVKIEGAYHGSHLEALVSTNMALDGTEGPDNGPASRAWGLGVPSAILEQMRIVPFNDLEAVEEALSGEEVAALITEPILFNVGAIWPAEGYLQGLRDLCEKYGTKLIFDETKTCATIAWGGAEELFGVRPHIKTLGKAVGGGLALAAFGETDSDEGYNLIHEGAVPHLGTFSGNPLAARAGLSALTEVLTPDAYATLEAHLDLLRAGFEDILSRHELDAYFIGSGAKSCLVWSQETLCNFRDYKRHFDFELGYLCWLWLVNRGVLLAPGQDEQMTHGVFHTSKEAGRLIELVDDLAEKLGV